MDEAESPGRDGPGAGVDTTAILLISGALFLWCVLSGRLERDDLTAPIVFVAIGGTVAVTGRCTCRGRR